MRKRANLGIAPVRLAKQLVSDPELALRLPAALLVLAFAPSALRAQHVVAVPARPVLEAGADTNDGLPLIGELSPKQFICTGYAGNGMTFNAASVTNPAPVTPAEPLDVSISDG